MFKFSFQFLGSINTWARWFNTYEEAEELRDIYNGFLQWWYIEEFNGE